jgi:two-component system OmpR family sensor kinase
MMSIRLRLSLLYTAILAITLIIFGAILYTVQHQYTLNSLRRDLLKSGQSLSRNILWSYQHLIPMENNPQLPPPPPLQALPDEMTFQGLREREIVRVLDASGALVASPLSGDQQALPLSSKGLQVLSAGQVWWEIANVNGERLLISDHPVNSEGQILFIVQVARTLTERDRSLSALSNALLLTSLVIILAAFGIGWLLVGLMLQPIQHITQTAQAIGNESDFTRRVNYNGPNDEVGQLAKTFNMMLARLQDAYERVRHALKMQRDFVADASHELRTPLTTVRGNLELLRRDPPLAEAEQDDVLTDMVDESDRLIRLVNELLILARADAGRNLVHEPIELNPIVEEVCRQAQQLDEQREITAAVQDVTVLGDRDALKQVLLILLDNALKHTQGPVTILAKPEGDQIAIAVQDAGPGIPPEILQHVFDRFYRGDADPQIPGFGLGLPIAKALVEEMGGTIAIDSQPGIGSVVRVQLPQYLPEKE